jgi:glycosyltransferase involved in cell wall biosynthesis
VHPSLNRAGGAEKVCLQIINALSSAGYKVTLLTVDKTNWHLLADRCGIVPMPFRQLYLFEKMPVKNLYGQAMLTFLLWYKLVLKMRSVKGVIFNTYGEFADLMADICYVNALPFRIHRLLESQYSLVKCSASRVYDLFLRALDEHFRCGVLLVNSMFVKDAVQKFLGKNSIVVYPPVEVKKFEEVAASVDRENLVVTVSRFRREKNLGIIPRIAKCVKEGEFLIIGVADAASGGVIDWLMHEIKRFGVDDRVKLVVNPSFGEMVKCVGSAKLFLQTQFTEAFGMSVVEAMAAGCVPVVPRCGGPWFDILEQKQGVYGFSYGSVEEAANLIRMLLNDEKLRGEVVARARERVRVFDSSVFERKILDVVDKVFKAKFE